MPSIADLADRLEARRQGREVFVVGLTGAVAVGKSTLAESLAKTLGGPDAAVEIVSTDGFLRPNAELDALGLSMRKGFPESYDTAALAQALNHVRRGPARFPGYSHHTYDIDPVLARAIDGPAVLIVEGLCLTRATPLDALIYLDAEEADIEGWFTRRLVGLWRAGLTDPASFYARFAHLDEDGARALAAAVWAGINRPNLIENILPVRGVADIVVCKASDHAISTIL